MAYPFTFDEQRARQFIALVKTGESPGPLTELNDILTLAGVCVAMAELRLLPYALKDGESEIYEKFDFRLNGCRKVALAVTEHAGQFATDMLTDVYDKMFEPVVTTDVAAFMDSSAYDRKNSRLVSGEKPQEGNTDAHPTA